MQVLYSCSEETLSVVQEHKAVPDLTTNGHESSGPHVSGKSFWDIVLSCKRFVSCQFYMNCMQLLVKLWDKIKNLQWALQVQ